MATITPAKYNPLTMAAPKAPIKLLPKKKVDFSSIAPKVGVIDPLAQAKVGTKATGSYNITPSIQKWAVAKSASDIWKTKQIFIDKQIVASNDLVADMKNVISEWRTPDINKLKQLYPEFSKLDDSILRDLTDDIGNVVAEWREVEPEKLKQLYPELYDINYKAPNKTIEWLKKATDILKWGTEFMASWIQNFVEWGGGTIEKWLNKASDYLLWTNAVEEARLRDEKLKWKWVITTPFWIDTTTPAAQIWGTVWKVIWTNTLIPSPTLWWATFLWRVAKNAAVWWLTTQASTLLSEWRLATPTETAIWAGTQWLLWGIANVKSTKQLKNLVQPKMTPSVEAERAAKWLKTTNIFGKVGMKATKEEVKMADIAKKIWLNPSKTVTSNVNKTLSSLSKETDDLIKVVDDNPTIFNPKEIISRMKKVEKPLMIRWWENEAKYDAVIKKFEEILAWEKKNTAGLLKARKKLDAWINAEIPNLYNSDAMTPLKVAITKIRKIPNEWINERIWWDLVKNSLEKQSLMIDMVDNMAWKTEKTWTTAISRFVNNNRGKLWAAWALWWAYILKKMGIGWGGWWVSSYVAE